MNVKLDDVILFRDDEGSVTIKGIADLKDDTIWTTQKAMAEFFKKDPRTIGNHLNNIFKSEDLVKREVTIDPRKEGFIVNPDSKKQPVLYNLDALISVGFRINSTQAIRFRRWAIRIIRDYIIKGFVLDVEALKNEVSIEVSYFSQLEEQVQEISKSRKL